MAEAAADMSLPQRDVGNGFHGDSNSGEGGSIPVALTTATAGGGAEATARTTASAGTPASNPRVPGDVVVHVSETDDQGSEGIEGID